MNTGIPASTPGTRRNSRRPGPRAPKGKGYAKLITAALLAAFVLAVLAGAFLYATPPAGAQTISPLISNTGQTTDTAGIDLDATNTHFAQSFATGSNASGYTVESIGFEFHTINAITTAGSHLKVTLHPETSSTPGTALCTFDDPGTFTASGVQTFDAPTTTDALCPDLTNNTIYYAVIERVTNTTDVISLTTTAVTGEDTGGSAGWSIGNVRHSYATSWLQHANKSHQIEITGYAGTRNHPPSGVPTISGPLTAGKTLTADTSAITDPNGVSSASFSYKWFQFDGANDNEITGATNSTYEIRPADAGKQIKVAVAFNDDDGYAEGPIFSEPTDPVSHPSVGVPTINGTPRVDEILVADTSGITDPDGLASTTFSYQWSRLDGTTETTIAGATRSRYLLVAADAGTQVKVAVSFTDDEGHKEGPLASEYTHLVITDDVLVTNAEQTPESSGTLFISFVTRHAQGFTTGAHDDGYDLDSIGFYFNTISSTSTASSEITVTLNERANNGEPGSLLCTLSDPATFTTAAPNTFDTPTSGTMCPALSKNTTYFVVVERASGTTTLSSSTTTSNAEHAGRAAGWSISDAGYLGTTTTWSQNLLGADSFRIVVKGKPIIPEHLLIKNTAQTAASSGTLFISSVTRHAQGFTTGAHDDGYDLDSIGFYFNTISSTSTASSEITVTLNERANNGEPGSLLCTLSDPATFTTAALNTFDTPTSGTTCPALNKNTTYFVVVERASGTTTLSSSTTTSNAEDTGGAAGWSIANAGYLGTTTTWSQNLLGADSFRIVVKGKPIIPEHLLVKNTAQAVQSTTRPLTAIDPRHAQGFTTGVHQDGYVLQSIDYTFTSISDTSVAAANLQVSLNQESSGQPGNLLCILTDPATFSATGANVFTAPTSGTRCPTLAADTTYYIVVHRVDTSGSNTFTSSLTSSNAEDTSSAHGWFIANTGFIGTTSTWDQSLLSGAAFQIDVRGTRSNITIPAVSSIALTSSPGADKTYAIGDDVTATITFSEAVDVTGSPQLTLLFGTAEKTASCTAATNTTTMACSYTVVANDSATTGVGIKANSLVLNSGTIYATGSTSTTATLTHSELALQSDHLVDGIRPTLVTTGTDAPRTSADGTAVILTFSENLGSWSRSNVKLFVDGTTTVAHSTGTLSGRTTTITLTTAVLSTSGPLTVELEAEAVTDWVGNHSVALPATTVLSRVQTSPSAPTSLTATPAPDATPQLAVDLTWTAPAYDGGSAITSHQYRYNRNSGSFGGWTTIDDSAANGANATSFTVKGLSAINNIATTFTFEVRAVNANGNSDESDPATAIIRVPAALTVDTTAGDRQIEMNWTTPDNNGSAILRYQYAVTNLSTNTDVVSINTNIPGSDADTTTFTVTGLTNGVPYDLRIRAVNSIGGGLYSLSQGIIPATFPTAPRNLTAEPGDTQVTLRWNAPQSNGGDAIEEYQYQQKTGNGAFGSWTPITGSNANTTEHTVTGLTNGTSYSFKVRAKNTPGEGPASNEVTAVPRTVPTAPQNFAATTGNGRVQLDWTAPASNGGLPINRYQYRYKAGTGSFTTWTNVPGSNVNTTTYTVTGLTNGTIHTFEVRAATASTFGVAVSGTETPMADPPDKPSVRVQGRDTELYVSWTVADDGGSPITEHQVQWKSGTQSFDSSRQQDGFTTTNTLIENLTNGTEYDVQVRVMNSAGWSPWSDSVSRTPVEGPAVSLSTMTLTIDEGTSDAYYVGIVTEPTSTVTIRISAEGNVTTEPTRLSFTASNWETRQRVTVDAGQDSDLADDTFTITHTISTGSAAEYTALTEMATVQVTVLDDDIPPPAVRGFIAADESQDAIALSWWSERGAAEYQLEHRKQGDTGNWTQITRGDFDHAPSTSSNRSLTGIATGLECNTTYDFRIRMRGSGNILFGALGPHTEISHRTGQCAQPDKPTNLMYTLAPDCATLTWTAPTAGDYTGVRIRRLTRGDDNYTVIHESLNSRPTSYRDCTNTGDGYGDGDNPWYSYRVTYIKSGSRGIVESKQAKSGLHQYGPAFQDHLHATPRNVRLTRDTDSQRRMTWEAPPSWSLTTWAGLQGANVPVSDPWTTGYVVERREFRARADGYFYFPEEEEWEVLRPGNDGDTTTSFNDNEQANGRKFVYRIMTTNALGTSTTHSIFDWLWDSPYPDAVIALAATDTTTDDEASESTNTPASGAPSIDGTPRVGETLTASTSAISDQNGLTQVSYSYQWNRNNAGISGATGSTYTLTDSDQGETITVQVTFTDDEDNAESLTSAATGAVLPPAPLTATFPASPYQSARHTGTDDRPQVIVAFSLPVASFQKTTPSVSLTGATVSSVRRHQENGLENTWIFFLNPDGTDDIVFSLVTSQYCDSGGICTDDGRRLSSAVQTTLPGPDDPNSPATGAPTISGTPQVEQTLTADTSAIQDADGLQNVNYQYQWMAGGAAISGATGSTYTLTANEQGDTIQVRVDFEDDAANSETLTSVATDPVAAAKQANTAPTGLPTINGTPQVEQTLTADTSTINDGNGLTNVSYAYQWLAAGTAISRATGSTYQLTSTEQGKTIQVRVDFTDDAGNSESLISVATDAVAAKPVPLTATFSNVPDSHSGSGEFTFDLTFSENFPLSYRTLRDHAFTEDDHGPVTKAQRKVQGSNQTWTITVEPDGNGAITITLPATTDCNATGAICTDDGRKLSNSTTIVVPGPQ